MPNITDAENRRGLTRRQLLRSSVASMALLAVPITKSCSPESGSSVRRVMEFDESLYSGQRVRTDVEGFNREKEIVESSANKRVSDKLPENELAVYKIDTPNGPVYEVVIDFTDILQRGIKFTGLHVYMSNWDNQQKMASMDTTLSDLQSIMTNRNRRRKEKNLPEDNKIPFYYNGTGRLTAESMPYDNAAEYPNFIKAIPTSPKEKYEYEEQLLRVKLTMNDTLVEDPKTVYTATIEKR